MAKIKICGVTRLADFRLAQRCGADFIGFVFAPGSPRRIDPETARRIAAAAPHRSRRVGVFVNEGPRLVREIYRHAGLDLVQLHGEEDPAYCRALGLPYWKAFAAADGAFLGMLHRYDCRTILLDGGDGAGRGGTGRTFDWSFAALAMKTGRRVVVAGGVAADNVAGLLRLGPYAVDVCSSLERRPGVKSPQKVARFFRALREGDFPRGGVK